MSNATDFQKEPREYALDLVDEGFIRSRQMLAMCLRFMSHEDIRQMLDDNELSPRFLQ